MCIRDRPYIESNPYKEELAKAGELVESYHELLPGHTDRKLKLEDAVDPVSYTHLQQGGQ